MAEHRLDKWLWAARFFKTRGLAAEAVAGGKVHVNGGRVKPAKTMRPGDTVEIRRGPFAWTIVVRALAERRGPASLAVSLYEETAESRDARERIAARMREEAEGRPDRLGRPTKKARRDAVRLTRGRSGHDGRERP